MPSLFYRYMKYGFVKCLCEHEESDSEPDNRIDNNSEQREAKKIEVGARLCT